jgi:hypothetical protein
MTGSMVNKSSLDYINNKYKDFSSRFRPYNRFWKVISRQAIHSGKHTWQLTIARRFLLWYQQAILKEMMRIRKEQHQVDCQAAHLKILKASGNYPEISFGEINELVAELYRSHLSEILNAIPNIQPINLPYQTIGNDLKEERYLWLNCTGSFQPVQAMRRRLPFTGLAAWAKQGWPLNMPGNTRMIIRLCFSSMQVQRNCLKQYCCPLRQKGIKSSGT